MIVFVSTFSIDVLSYKPYATAYFFLTQAETCRNFNIRKRKENSAKLSYKRDTD